jgi:hypothetical protein
MIKISKKFNSRKMTISEEEFQTLNKTAIQLKLALSFERNCDFVIQNYLEYELTIAKTSIDDLVNKVLHRPEFNKKIRDINLNLINFLSTTKAYIDKSSSLIKKLTADSVLFSNTCASYYDNCFSYRLVDALRNYAQHSSDPFSLLTIGSRIEKI